MLKLDKTLNSEFAKAPSVPYHEVPMEFFEFETSKDDEMVRISVSIPFSGHITSGAAASNALRIYLDGDGMVGVDFASYWNGKLLFNSGVFPFQVNLPCVGHLSGSLVFRIPKQGKHRIQVMSSGATLSTFTTIKSQRAYQVETLEG